MPSVLTMTLPLAGSVALAKVGVSPSASVAVSWPLTGVSSAVVAVRSLPTGASLTGVTVRLTVTGAEVAPLASLMV
ncbi:hypothetical protein D3C86_1656900 [compost metagenome]